MSEKKIAKESIEIEIENQCGSKNSLNKKHVCNLQTGHKGVCTDGEIIW